MRYAVVQSGLVTNIVEWDGDITKWNPGSDAEAILDDGTVEIGCAYENGTFLALPDPEITIPQVVSPRQMKLALYGAGLLDNIEAFVAQAPRPVQISWEYAVEFRREDPLLNQMAAMLGMNDSQLDGLFSAASSI
jgi:hypothetical protein